MFWISWGHKSRRLIVPGVEHYPCHYCERDQPATIAADYTVRHLWYLFRWISDRSYTAFCNVCQSRMMGLKAKTYEAKHKSPFPFFDRWGWAIGLGLVGVFIAAMVLLARQEDADYMAYLHAPRVGDVYAMKSPTTLNPECVDCYYSAARVVSVDEMNVYIQASKRVANQSFADLQGADYLPQTYKVPRQNLEPMKLDGTVLYVTRPEGR